MQKLATARTRCTKLSLNYKVATWSKAIEKGPRQACQRAKICSQYKRQYRAKYIINGAKDTKTPIDIY